MRQFDFMGGLYFQKGRPTRNIHEESLEIPEIIIRLTNIIEWNLIYQK